MSFRTRPLRCAFGTALLLSLGIHGLLGLSVWAFSSAAGRQMAGPPLPVDALLIESDGEFTLTLSDSSPQPRQPKAGQHPRESNDDAPPPITFPISISDPRANSTLPGIVERKDGGSETNDSSAPGHPGGSKGARQDGITTAFFQVETRGQTIVYVIDRSSSMGPGGALEAAKQELLASLERLPDTACFQVILYNLYAEPLRIDGSNQLRATPEVKRQIANWVETLRAEGSTNHLPALRRALEIQPDVIFLVTDADGLSQEQVTTLTRQNHGRTVIHTVEVTGSQHRGDEVPMRRLAHNNRGTYQALRVR